MSLFFILLSVLLGRSQHASSPAEAAATVATAQGAGPRTVESRCLPPQLGAASIIQVVPQLLDPEQEVLPTEAQSDRGDDVLFSQLSDVKEACEFGACSIGAPMPLDM